MTVKLAYNGSVLAQNAVIYSQCLQYQKDVPISLRPHSGSFFLRKTVQKLVKNWHRIFLKTHLKMLKWLQREYKLGKAKFM